MLYQANAADALLADFVASALPLPLQVMIAAHLEMSAQNRAWFANLEAMAGIGLTDAEPAALTDPQKILDNIFSSKAAPADTKPASTCEGIPAVLEKFIGSSISDIAWKNKAFTKFQERQLGKFDGYEASLYRLPPATAVPQHTHHGSEVTLVLKGAFKDETGHYKRGDIAIADSGVDHRPVADEGGECICFAVTDAPLRLSGPLGRFIAPFQRA